MNIKYKKKIYLIVLFIALYIIPIQVYAECSLYCNHLVPIIKIIKNGVIPIFQIITPIILILMGMIDLGKAVTSGKEEEMKKSQSLLVKRAVYAVAIFFVITGVQLLFRLFFISGADAEVEGTQSWWQCYNNVGECTGEVSTDTPDGTGDETDRGEDSSPDDGTEQTDTPPADIPPVTPPVDDADSIPSSWLDNGIFSSYYSNAYQKLQTLTLDEKIGQLFLIAYVDSSSLSDISTYKVGGFVFLGGAFSGKTESQVISLTNSLQSASSIPLLLAVDEEGGTVVRVSNNPNLAPEKFKSPRELYNAGGLDAIKNDAINKNSLLKHLGLNLNLAPVVDVSTNSSDFMYQRSLGQNSSITSDYARIVIETSKGSGVSCTLKHFPGYGNNADTHTGTAVDNRTYEYIQANDLPPFAAGINAGAEAVMVSHNIVSSVDANNPASISSDVHNILRNDLGFTGVIITDDMGMGAVSNISDAVVKAVLSDNDLIATNQYASDIQKLKTAVSNGTVSEEIINRHAFRVLAWKYYKGLM